MKRNSRGLRLRSNQIIQPTVKLTNSHKPMPVQATTNSQHRYTQLDSLRGLAALFVFFTHYLGAQIASPSFNVIKKTPLGVLFNGNAAVMFFFVLSGFVLSLPFVSGDKPLKLTAFYLKRIFRIYPAFIFAILFSLLLKEFVFNNAAMAHYANGPNFWNWGWTHDNLTQFWHTLLLIGPGFNNSLIDPPIWSLVIETGMSVLLPFFIMIVARGSAMLNIILLFAIIYLTYQHDAWALPVFYTGILMAKYKVYLVGNVGAWSVFRLIIIVCTAILLYNNGYEFSIFIQSIALSAKYTFSSYLMAMGSCIIIIIVLARANISAFFQRRIFTFLGDISYSFYLIHVPLLLTTTSLLINRYALSPIYIFLLTLLLAVGISYLMFIFIEKPFQKIAAKLTRKYKLLNAIRI